VNEAEEERLHSEQEHQRVTQLCHDAEARVQTLQKALRKVILKSKPYFELKAQFNHILEVCKMSLVFLNEHHTMLYVLFMLEVADCFRFSNKDEAKRVSGDELLYPCRPSCFSISVSHL